MQDIMEQFQTYLFLYKKVSVNTYNAYKKDIEEFIYFLLNSGRTIDTVKPQDYSNYIMVLRKKKLSSATGLRKIAALKAFARYLHDTHGNAFCEDAFILPADFPLMCNHEKVHNYLQTHKNRLQTHKELRNYIITYLLASVKVGIKYVVKLRTYDILAERSAIRIHNKEIELPTEFFTIIKRYLEQIPHASSYLFPIKAGCTIKHVPVQAVWSQLRLLFNSSKQTNEPLVTKNYDLADCELKNIYKNKHPRP